MQLHIAEAEVQIQFYPGTLLLVLLLLFLLLLDLIAEETDATCHFVDTPNLPDKGTLERVDIGVQLVSRVSKLRPRYSRNR